VIAAFSRVPSNTSITGLPAAILPLLLVIAPVHAVLAFSPAAKVPTWREACPGRAPGTRQQPLDDAVPPKDRQPDAEQGHPKPTLTDLKAWAHTVI
jgi:hypothetical protein